MAIEMDAEFESDELFSGGSEKAPPGWYHVQLENAEETQESIDLRFVVVSPGDHVGKKIYERLWLSGKDGDVEKSASARKKIHRYAICLRLFTQEENDAARAAGKRIVVDFPAAIGAQAVVEVKSREGKNRKGEDTEYLDIHWRIYDLASREAENCQLDREFAGQWGVTADNPFASAGGGKAPNAPQTVAAKATPKASPKPAAPTAPKASYADI